MTGVQTCALPIWEPGKKLQVANSEDYLLRTGPCSVRRNRLNLGASPPAGPALQTGGSTGAESDSRETLKSYLNSTARRNWKINCGRNVRFRGWRRAAGIAYGANWRTCRNEAKSGLVPWRYGRARHASLLQGTRNDRGLEIVWPHGVVEVRISLRRPGLEGRVSGLRIYRRAFAGRQWFEPHLERQGVGLFRLAPYAFLLLPVLL